MFKSCLLGAVVGLAIGGRGVNAQPLAELQQAYVGQRLGMFLHFNMGTFTGEEWAAPAQPVHTFAPTALDPTQWATAAKSAGMTYGVLTTKHHDGFALWDTAQSSYDVAATAWFTNQPPGQGDIVRRYADAFRAQGLNVGFYYSIWDRTNGIDGNTRTSRQATDYVKAELTELLSNYGPIHAIWTDGWGWKNWHAYVKYEEVYAHIKTLSPNTLLVENNHTATNTDIRTYEQTPLPPPGNVFPAELCATIRADNKWFWSAGADLTKPVDVLADQRDTCNARFAAFLLDVTPDPRGLIPDSQLAVLAALGAAPRYESLALARQAIQSSTWNRGGLTLTADKAVDGLLTANNMAHTDLGDVTPWWRVDLETARTIDRVVIHNRAGFAGRLRDLTIEVLNGNTQAVYTSELLNPDNVLGGGISEYNGDAPATVSLALPPGVLGRYVRITRLAAGSTNENLYVLTLPEVQVLHAVDRVVITAIHYIPSTEMMEVTLYGEPETSYRLISASDLRFEDASPAPLSQGDPDGDPGLIQADDTRVTTDLTGIATVRIHVAPATRAFIRAIRAP